VAYKNLREFMEVLEDQGDLIRIKDEVNPSYEVAAYVRKSSDVEGPAILFEKVQGTNMKVLGGLFGAKRRVLQSLELDEKNLLTNYLKKEGTVIMPRNVDKAPSQEIVLTGNDIDLYSLPQIIHFEKDAGPYITGGIQIAKSRRTGKRNAGMYRMLILDKNHLTVYAPPGRHLRIIIEQNLEENEPTDVATAIGTDPVIPLASQTRKAFGYDEIEIAGGLRGAPVEMVGCKTINVDVPATAEIVIEGRTVPGREAEDGPFGEYPGTYSDVKKTPVVEVTAITMRKDPIYQFCMTGTPMTENHHMMELPLAALAYEEAYKICPDVVDVVLTPGGTSRHHAVVSIKKRHDYEPRNVILALLAANIGIKYVVVVDHDIDIRNQTDVEWAINTRMQAQDDVLILPTMYSPTLDPSAPMHRSSSKMGIDATAPLGRLDEFSKVKTPGTDTVDLSKYWSP